MKWFNNLIVFGFLFLIQSSFLFSQASHAFTPISESHHILLTSQSFYDYFVSEHKQLKKGQFICLAKKELSSLVAKDNCFYAPDADIHPNYTMNTASWIQLIRPLAPKTPLVKNILDQIIDAQSSIKTVQDLEQLFKTILNVCNTTKWLSKHYTTHEMAYLQKTSLAEIATKTEVFKSDISNDFKVLIKTFSVHLLQTIDDPNYPPNKEKIERTKKEQQALKEEFHQAYRTWINQSNENIKAINTDLYQKVVQKAFFVRSIEKWRPMMSAAQPELTKLLLNNILEQLKGEYIRIEHYVEVLQVAIQLDYMDMVGEDVLFKNWQQNSMFPNLNSLITTLHIKNEEDPHAQFNAIYQSWQQVHYNQLDKHPEWSKQTTFEKTKVLKALKSMLDFNERRFLLSIFEKHFKTLPEVATLENYSKQWKKAMDEVVQINSLKENFNYTSKNKAKDNSWLNQLLLPNKYEIYRLFDANNRP